MPERPTTQARKPARRSHRLAEIRAKAQAAAEAKVTDLDLSSSGASFDPYDPIWGRSESLVRVKKKGVVAKEYRVMGLPDYFSATAHRAQVGPDFLQMGREHESLRKLEHIEHQFDELLRHFKTLESREEEHFRTLVQRIEVLETDASVSLLDGEQIDEDPYFKWCQDNLGKIREISERLGPCYLAIDISRGEFVLAEPNQEEFIRKFELLDEEIRKSVYRVNSSFFV